MVVLEPNGSFLSGKVEESPRFEPGLRRLSELLPAALALHGIQDTETPPVAPPALSTDPGMIETAFCTA
jgi:hypothetical protein